MAKDVSKEEDDDDKFEKMDEESLGFLEQVRKGKSRNFVLSMKGNKVRSMIVKKKPIKEKDRKAAKGEGYQPVYGVVTGMGAKISFSIARSDGFDERAAECKTEKLKKFLKEQTDKAFKPTFELVDSPPPIPFDDEDLSDPLIAKFMKLELVIAKACTAHPDRVPQLQATVNEIRELLPDDETRPQAGPKIDEFVQFLKELLSGAASSQPVPPVPDPNVPDPNASVPPPAPPHPPGSDTTVLAGKLAEALKRLKPLMDQVIAADANRKGELHATMVQIAGEIKSQQFDQAKQNVTAFAAKLKSLVRGPTPTATADEFAKQWSLAQNAWRSAVETVDGQLAELQRFLNKSSRPELQRIAEFGLNGVTNNHKVPLMVALREVDMAGGDGFPKSAAKALKVIGDFQKHLATDRRVLACDRNPYAVKVTIRKTIGDALGELEAALRRANVSAD